MRPSEIYPKNLIEEWQRLAAIERDWLNLTYYNETDYYVGPKYPTWITNTIKRRGSHGHEYLAMFAPSCWLHDGPKTFKPTKEQCIALENVEVNIPYSEYQQPYPAIMVELNYPPFNCCLCFQWEEMLVFVLNTKDHLLDITTTISRRQSGDSPLENTIIKYDDDVKADSETAAKVLRVAINSCLALTHYGNVMDYLYPHEVASDRRLSQENSERGNRAKRRLHLAVRRVAFSQEIKLHREETQNREPGKSTGSAVTTHWRRGHWAMQSYGEKNSLRKRIFRRPVLVRADLLIGGKSQTEVVYRG